MGLTSSLKLPEGTELRVGFLFQAAALWDQLQHPQTLAGGFLLATGQQKANGPLVLFGVVNANGAENKAGC